MTSQLKVDRISPATGDKVNIDGLILEPSNRNLIINGDMRVDQRNAGVSVALNGLSYSVDRWGTQASQNSKATIQQSSTVPTGFTNSMVVTSSSAYSPLATDYFWLYQTIEGFNIADLNWGSASAQTVTLSFWVRSSLTGTFSVRVGSSFRSYVTTYTIESADTYEYKTVTIPGDTSGTWNTTNGPGIQVQFDLGGGSNRSTSTTNAWQAGDFQKATGSVSLVSTNGATFYITGVQLEAGDEATPFEHRSYGQELALCQRYYNQYSYSDGGGGADKYGVNTSASMFNSTISYPVEMRAIPSLKKLLPPIIRGGTEGTHGVSEKTMVIRCIPTSAGEYRIYDGAFELYAEL